MVIFKLIFRYAGIVGVSYHIKLYVVLRIKPGILHARQVFCQLNYIPSSNRCLCFYLFVWLGIIETGLLSYVALAILAVLELALQTSVS